MAISHKIIGGYVVILVLLALVTGVAFYALRQTQTTYDDFLNVDERLLESGNDLMTVTYAQQSYVRGILLYPDIRQLNQTLLEANDRQYKEIFTKMHRLMRMPERIAFISELESIQQQLLQAQQEVLRLAAEQKNEEAIAYTMKEFRFRSIALIEKAKNFYEEQTKLLDKGRINLAEEVRLYTLTLVIVSLLAIFAGMSIGMHLGRVISSQLRESIAQLSSSSAEILATATQVASGAAETAAAVSETTATVEEVKQTAQLASQKAKYVSDTAQKASTVSQAGRESVEEAILGMQRIQEQMESIAGSIVQLSEQGQAIGEIIATVNDLAEQSNLLAVNAAIEATRAGEQGKSFGVVAQEIKSLAEQSRQATSQVRRILGDIQKATNAAVLATEQGNKAVEAGVKQSNETSESIRLLSASINDAAQAATQISVSSQQQMIGMDQIVLAMNNIKEASEQNVAGTKQAELAAHSLHEMGAKLSIMVSGKRAQ
jgi:methyl-accepting chemotaxis protein